LGTAHFGVARRTLVIVVGQFKSKKWEQNPKLGKKLPWKIDVEFSSQLGFKFGFGGSDFGDEGEAPLELAYALTIHKAQGSEFGMTFIVVPNPCRLLSRELLYTCPMRDRAKVHKLSRAKKAGEQAKEEANKKATKAADEAG